MGPSLYFCYTCNQRFTSGDAETPRCPQCGLTLDDMSTAPTVKIDEVAAREALTPAGEPSSRGGSAADELVGTVVGGYTVEEFLGRGGMARVYRVLHHGLDRRSALKVLSPSLVKESPGFVDLFLAEARAAASLVHPHIVTVHNVGTDRGLHFIEMEYVEGSALGKQLLETGRFGSFEATRWLAQAAAGLAEAHRKGIVHRDFKPANVLLSDQGIAKLADFGLAKRIVGSDASETNLVGTPHFMAPELFSGGSASPESDVYAAGVSFYFLLTGKLPFSAPTITEVAIRHRESPIPDPRALAPGVPERARAILEICLAKKKQDRYAHGAGLHEELRSLLGSLRSLEDVLRDALAGLRLDFHRAGRDRFRVEVPLPGGRTHRVFVEKAAGQVAGEELLRVSSPCAPVDEAYLRKALELNAGIDHGSISIQEHRGKPHFVMANVYPWATCDPEEIRESVVSVATWGDELEQTLTGEDRY